MTDKVLTDDERDALLDGLSRGEVEVQTNIGPLYAEVRNFVVGPRSRIATNSYPRLRVLNKQLAGRMGKQAEQFLDTETDITVQAVESCLLSKLTESMQPLSLAVEFTVAPLKGSGLLYMESGIIGHLVEAFFGGSGDEAIPQDADFFSPGEISVTNLFTDVLLNTLQIVWQPMIEFSPERIATRHGTDLLADIEATDEVICTQFAMTFAGHQEIFHLVWPVATVSSLLPLFKGQKRERNATEDRRWEKTLRSRAAGLIVGISSCTGHAQLSLADVAALQPGDIIDIDNPRNATLFAQQVPVLEGLFGVHEGRNAIEARRWLRPDSDIARISGISSS